MPADGYVVPPGRAAVKRAGRDLTIVAVGATVATAPQAANELAAGGIDAEVVDLRSLVPLDEATTLKSVRRTSRAIVLDTGHARFGITGEIAALIGEQTFDWLDAPVRRLGAPNVPIPSAAPWSLWLSQAGNR